MSVRPRLLSVVAVLALLGPLGTMLAASTAAASGGTGTVGGDELASTAEIWHVPAGVPRPPALPAQGYLLADLTTGQILVAKDAHLQQRTASTMKVLTALTLLPRLSPDLVYTARRADEDIDGSKVGIVAGSTYTVRQLFLGMMLSSGNDAANALANAAGGVPSTVALMQQEATALGALDTTVRDPSGLDSPGQRSSAYDLGLIARAAMQRPDFRALVATKTTKFPGRIVKGKRGKGFQIQNHNELLTHYRGAIGVKTGYTVAARWTYVGAAQRGDHTYLVTEMGLKQTGWQPVAKLLDWAFAHGTSATPFGRLVDPGEVAASTAAAGSSPAPAAAAGRTDALAAAGAGPSVSTTARWAGIAGLACAAAIVGGLALSAARRRRRA
jgi:serine-type D-Ala-D-Ala carboxypeptidase (penicillin-binding protein 5/6)